ncbi:MAG: hypothetical protein COB35_09215 [Gammaproteobacteria bacterium]|nr:MAG: hypothetical protein COB35_09215 [Gammaproteobacteria bacterium]
MLTCKKTTLLLIGSLLTLSSMQAISAPTNNEDQDTLKIIMQGLLKNTHKITQGIVLHDFALIEKAAKNIAEHPKPSMMTRMKLVKAMGADMGKFKTKDDVVHHSSVNLIKAAQQKDMPAIQQEYQIMINGCVACHNEFKERVAKILSK